MSTNVRFRIHDTNETPRISKRFCLSKVQEPGLLAHMLHQHLHGMGRTANNDARLPGLVPTARARDTTVVKNFASCTMRDSHTKGPE